MFTSRFSNSEVEAIDIALGLLLKLNGVEDGNGLGNWAVQSDPSNPYFHIHKAVRAMIEWHYGPETTDIILDLWCDNFEGFRYNEKLAADELLEKALGR